MGRKGAQGRGGPWWRMAALLPAALACSTDPGPMFAGKPIDPARASMVQVDRFSAEAAQTWVRSDSNSLPAAGDPIDFDAPPFLVRGLGPKGQHLLYYDLDVRSQVPGKLYTFSAEGKPLPAQLPLLARIPGDSGYNDFVRVFDVAAPPGYEANAIRSEADLLASRFLITPTDTIINLPVVPDGSSALLRARNGSSALESAWYDGQIARALRFEAQVPSQSIGYGERAVDISSIYIAYNINSNLPGGGPASGLRTEAGSDQTHNVTDSVPGEPLYSPLWMIIIYDNAAFDRVEDDESAEDAPVVPGVFSPLLNAPVVEVDAEAEVRP
jgi:hypothetical protein